jgi:hypothetical protein
MERHRRRRYQNSDSTYEQREPKKSRRENRARAACPVTILHFDLRDHYISYRCDTFTTYCYTHIPSFDQVCSRVRAVVVVCGRSRRF